MARRYGAGTVYQLPNGRWSGQWSAGRDELGNRMRGTVTADTEAAAWKALGEARGKSSSSIRRRGGESVGAFLERWLDSVVRKENKERTYWGYRSIVEHHLTDAFGSRPLRALKRAEVQAWVDHHERSPLTVRHHVDVLRNAMAVAVRWGLRDDNPAVGLVLPAVKRRTVAGIDDAVAKRWLAACEGTWFAPMVTVALYTGLRQGELLGLRWEDVNLRAATLTVRHSLTRLPGRGKSMRYVLDTPKSETSRRTVPLLPVVVEALEAERVRQMTGPGTWKGLVFAHEDGPIDGTTLTHHFQAAFRAKGLEPVRWHDLRHATASLLIASGVDLPVVSSILGHSGIAITVDTYGHLTEGVKRSAMEHMAAKMAATG